jgi:dUTP pyrophosphatase
VIKFKLLTEDAKAPSRATSGSAGFDLYTLDSLMLEPGHRALFRTGVACQIPTGYWGLLKERSGVASRYAIQATLAYKHGADILAGVMDSDYRYEIMVLVINHGLHSVKIRKGDRIAQMIVSPYLGLSEVVEELDETGRGGFGSTGE